MNYNITKEEFEKRYDNFLNKLFLKEGGHFHKLTTNNGTDFGILRNTNSVYVKALTKKETEMVISKNQLIDVVFNNKKFLYSSYEPVVIDYIINDKLNDLSELCEYYDYYESQIKVEKNRLLPIAVLTHNPKGEWGDVREQIEKGGYNGWGVKLKLKIGQKVLIYISSNVRQIQYIMKVESINNNKTVDLKLIKKIDDKKSKLLSYENLKEQGLKPSTINYFLNNNEKLYTYVINILNLKNNPSNSIQIKNIILYGAPGVGKTHNYQRIISMIENGDSEKDIFDTITNNEDKNKVELDRDIFQTIKNDKRVEFITFHQSYSYEDFIEGFRPTKKGIKLKKGIFNIISKKALKQPTKNFYIVIDEINRGNISKIFGELITLIEEDKRDIYEVTLPYSKELFKIPSNLYIIATMNSTDKSIATIDIALRRRFTFLKMKPNLELVEDEEARNFMDKLNQYIEKSSLGEDYKLGHSYFMGKDIDLEFIKEYKIKPLLEEYFYAEDKTPDDIIKKALEYRE